MNFLRSHQADLFGSWGGGAYAPRTPPLPTGLVSIRVRQRALNRWYSSDIAEAKFDRRRLERRGRRSKLEVDRQLFVEARNNVSRLLLDAKTSFYSVRIQELSGNQKALIVQ